MEALSIDTWPARIAELFLGKWKLLVYVRNNVPAKLFFLLVFLDLKMAVTRANIYSWRCLQCRLKDTHKGAALRRQKSLFIFHINFV